VKALRAHLSAADAVFFGVEEFNYSLSGDECAPDVLK
jgi:NAD(P)H-dependent FMN reductase